MSKMLVVMNEQDAVLGTLVVNGSVNGSGGPESYGIHTGPGERVFEIEVDDSLSELEPAELHAAIAERHLTPANRMLVVVDEANAVLGTLVVNSSAKGSGGPESYGIHAGPGERVFEIEVDDSLSDLAPAELHAVISERHLATSSPSF